MLSEFLKLRFNRSNTILALIAAAALLAIGLVMLFIDPLLNWLIGLNDVVPNATNAHELSPAERAALRPDNPATIWLFANITGTVGGNLGAPIWCALIIGAIAATWEYRTGAIIPTMLAESQPWKVVAHKTLAVGTAVTAGSFVLVAISAGLLLAARQLYGAVLPEWSELVGNWLVGTLGLGLAAILGTMIGFVIRSQLWTILIIVAYGMLESAFRQLATLLASDVTPAHLLPFGLPADAMQSSALLGYEAHSLGAAASLSLLLGWVLLLGTATVVSVTRRVYLTSVVSTARIRTCAHWSETQSSSQS